MPSRIRLPLSSHVGVRNIAAFVMYFVTAGGNFTIISRSCTSRFILLFLASGIEHKKCAQFKLKVIIEVEPKYVNEKEVEY